MKNYAEQIAAFEARRSANLAAMDEIMSKAADEGATLDKAEQEEFDELQADNEAIDSHLKRLRALEREAARKATPVNKVDKEQDGTDRRARIQVKAPKLPAGVAFARVAKVKALAKLDGDSVREKARELYGEDSQTYQHFAKAAVPAGTSEAATGSWGSELVGDETSAFADFVEFLRPMTILGKFGMNGIPSLRTVPFRTPLLGQTSGGEGYWVGEGKPKPLTQFDFTRRTLDELKVANIAVATEELLRKSSPSAETILRDQLAAALRARMDTDFIDPSNSGGTATPASVTNGVTPVTSSGTDADAVRADIKALFETFIAANNAPTSGVWIMPTTVALALSLMQNPLGQPEFGSITMNGGTLFGLPVISSEFVPTVTAGAYVILANAQDIYFADEGGINVDMSREASLQMDDSPTNDSGVPTATSLVSMFQTNSVAFRAERILNWLKRRDEAVAVLDGVNWG